MSDVTFNGADLFGMVFCVLVLSLVTVTEVCDLVREKGWFNKK